MRVCVLFYLKMFEVQKISNTLRDNGRVKQILQYLQTKHLFFRLKKFVK
jgi:hypothetical protein